MLIAVGFVPDETATAAELARAGRENASTLWMWAISAGFVYWGASLWWAAVPGLVALHAAIAWVSCKREALLLRDETAQIRKRKHGIRAERAANSNEFRTHHVRDVIDVAA